jgi:hypothetical protein
MLNFLYPTKPRLDERARAMNGYAAATALVTLALFVAAIGAGNPGTPVEDKLPVWVDVAANVVSAAIGVAVLMPKTRGMACIAAVVSMMLSMGANYAVDGFDFFVTALPFNVTTLGLASVVAWRELSAEG